MSSKLINTWSRVAEEEDSMTDDHAWIWREMIRAVEAHDISSSKILEFGCNQGGFLRLLYDLKPFASAVGVDLAREAIRTATKNVGDRPIKYIASDQVEDAGSEFDMAFSHEVIYLIDDLKKHAAQMGEILRPGANYFAVTCCHSDNPLWQTWRPRIAAFSNIQVPNHSVSDIAEAFRRAGFEVSISSFLANAFIPLDAPGDYFPTDRLRLEVYRKWKLMFRFTKQN